MKHLSLLSGIFGLVFCSAASAADITVFHSPSCPHCHHAREFISSTLIYEYPNLKVTEVNVMDPQNQDLFAETLKKCEYESGGVPVLVVGEKCFQGYADFMQAELRDAVAVDLSDADKKVASDNKAAMEKDADAFRAAHADRASAISEHSATVAQPEVAQKKTTESPIVFYVILVALVAALGFVLIRKDNKKK